jgi:uncharacterized protein
MTYLLDVNVLLALAWPSHKHHDAAHAWMTAVPRRSWASCAITQLAFVRLSANPRVVGVPLAPGKACKLLAQNTDLPTHKYWDDSPAPSHVLQHFSERLLGYRQTTDAYLLALVLARREAVFATFDMGLRSLISASDADRLEIISA